MKDIIVNVFQYGNVYVSSDSLGITYENLQGRLIFNFEEYIVEGTGYLEFERDDEKGLLPLTYENEQYYLEIKSSLLKKEGNIKLQLRITENSENGEIPVFKSEVFELEVKESINATSEIPDEYPEWIDLANAKIKEIDNLNITTERVEDGVNIKVTGKDGNITTTEVKDGTPGPRGLQGEPGAVKMEVVDTLPETALTDTIYLLKKENPTDENLYEEYVYTSTGWEHIGDTSVDLSDYYTKEESTENIYSNLDKFIKTILPKEGEDFIALNDGRLDNTEQLLIPKGVKIGYYYDGEFVPFHVGASIGNEDVFNGRLGLNSIRILSTLTSDITSNTNKYIHIVNFANSPSHSVATIYSGTYILYKNSIKKGSVSSPGSAFPQGPVITKGDLYTTYLTPYLTQYLSKTNTTSYTPTSDYNPATKKYVDDTISANITPSDITYIVPESEQNSFRPDQIYSEDITSELFQCFIKAYNYYAEQNLIIPVVIITPNNGTLVYHLTNNIYQTTDIEKTFICNTLYATSSNDLTVGTGLIVRLQGTTDDGLFTSKYLTSSIVSTSGTDPIGAEYINQLVFPEVATRSNLSFSKKFDINTYSNSSELFNTDGSSDSNICSFFSETMSLMYYYSDATSISEMSGVLTLTFPGANNKGVSMTLYYSGADGFFRGIGRDTSGGLVQYNMFCTYTNDSGNITVSNVKITKSPIGTDLTTYPNYDSSKDMVLKSVNGTISWVEE